MPANPTELGVLRVATPCARDWEKMTGDARARFCADCRLTVYNLSALTTDEARELIREKEGRLCVRFFHRADGTVITRDCPVGIARSRRLIAGGSALVASLAGLAALVLGVFAQAEAEAPAQASTALKAAPIAPPAAEKPADDGWIEQRRGMLAPRAKQAMGRPHTIGVLRLVKLEEK